MSTPFIGTAVDFAAEHASTTAKAGHGGHGVMGLISALFDAISTARAAELDYCKLVARGVSPADAVHKVFDRA